MSFWRIHSLDIDIISVKMPSLYLIVSTWFKGWPRLRSTRASSIIYEVVLRARAGSKRLRPRETCSFMEITNDQDSEPKAGTCGL